MRVAPGREGLKQTGNDVRKKINGSKVTQPGKQETLHAGALKMFAQEAGLKINIEAFLAEIQDHRSYENSEISHTLQTKGDIYRSEHMILYQNEIKIKNISVFAHLNQWYC